MVKLYLTTYYGMKDKRVIFQLSFMTGNDKTFCAKRQIVLSQVIFRSQPSDFPFG